MNDVPECAVSQRAAILNWLVKGYSITQWDAVAIFKCLRLSERIREIQQDGYIIGKAWEKRNKKRYRRYWLVPACKV